MSTLTIDIPSTTETMPPAARAAMAQIQRRPPLASGDRLTRPEFERRYDARPDIRKAELIEGVVYVPSPTSSQRHGRPHGDIMTWLGVYRAATPNLLVNDNSTLRLDLDNEMQPDACLWIEGGNAWEDTDDFLAGAPELIVEIAASSAAYDMHDKLRAYRRNGVQEYLVLLTYDNETRWFNWQGETQTEITSDADGVMRSRAFSGLWLHPGHFWQGDLAQVLAVLQQGIDTDEHQQFATQLAPLASSVG